MNINNRNTPSPLGEYLKELRIKKGVSVYEAQKATGMSNAYLTQLETGLPESLLSNRLAIQTRL